jgi:hypothetical protein
LSARALLRQFLEDHAGVSEAPEGSLIIELFDSVAFLDLFLTFEEAEVPVSLDEVASCNTVGDLYRLVDGL